jgi:hypothetical protein
MKNYVEVLKRKPCEDGKWNPVKMKKVEVVKGKPCVDGK